MMEPTQSSEGSMQLSAFLEIVADPKKYSDKLAELKAQAASVKSELFNLYDAHSRAEALAKQTSEDRLAAEAAAAAAAKDRAAAARDRAAAEMALRELNDKRASLQKSFKEAGGDRLFASSAA